MANPVYNLLQVLPTNGWITVIGGVGAIFFGIGGIITGQLEMEAAMVYVFGGLSALGLGNKAEQAGAKMEELKEVSKSNEASLETIKDTTVAIEETTVKIDEVTSVL